MDLAAVLTARQKPPTANALHLNPLVIYPSVDACIVDQKSKGKDDGAAQEICTTLLKSMTHNSKHPYDGFSMNAGGWWEDDDYLYMPVVATSEGVHNGAYKSSKELEKGFPFFENTPICILHPPGRGIMGLDEIHGFVRNTKFDANRSAWKGTACFIKSGERLRDMGHNDESIKGHLGLLDAIRLGAKLDGSIGYWHDVVQTPGVFDGVRYDRQEVNLYPDHLAVVDRGASDWQMGTGFGQNDSTYPSKSDYDASWTKKGTKGALQKGERHDNDGNVVQVQNPKGLFHLMGFGKQRRSVTPNSRQVANPFKETTESILSGKPNMETKPSGNQTPLKSLSLNRVAEMNPEVAKVIRERDALQRRASFLSANAKQAETKQKQTAERLARFEANERKAQEAERTTLTANIAELSGVKADSLKPLSLNALRLVRTIALNSAKAGVRLAANDESFKPGEKERKNAEEENKEGFGASSEDEKDEKAGKHDKALSLMEELRVELEKAKKSPGGYTDYGDDRTDQGPVPTVNEKAKVSDRTVLASRIREGFSKNKAAPKEQAPTTNGADLSLYERLALNSASPKATSGGKI